MDDRELLELAAKAAGMHKLTQWTSAIQDYDSPHYGEPALHEAGSGGECLSWNPLVNDGDALRLAVALMMDVSVCEDGSTAAAFEGEEADSFNSDADGDAIAATRRAIVRAAAEIGRAM